MICLYTCCLSSSTSHGGRRAVEKFCRGGGQLDWAGIFCPMNKFSWTFFLNDSDLQISWDYFGQRTGYKTLHILEPTWHSTTFSWFSPYLRGGRIGNLPLALLPLHLSCGVGLGVWLAGSFPVFCPCKCAVGAEGRGQPLHMTITPILRPTLNVPRNFRPLL
jgi:hypothetical protein